MTEERVTYTTQLEARIDELKHVIRDTEDDLAATITAQAARIAKLEAQIADMPVDALRRYVLNDDRIDNGRVHAEYSVTQYYEDYAEIAEWLISLDGDA